MEINGRIKTKTIVEMALMIAIICLVTMTMKVPTVIGYTHLGDGFVFVAAVVFGKRRGAIAAALGMTLADILGGYAIWAPFTFVIKAVMAYIAATLAYRNDYNGDNVKNNIFAFAVAGAWMVLAYYLANAVIVRYIYVESASFYESLVLALADIPANTMQIAVGIVVAILLLKAIKGKIRF
ncbi:ECF transporter S component [Clostridium peptidivorans]|uniref:ECF transporter S component n=1 Tax=Clostridium peptidivorans TaxID=100174 RepID=UPI000BE47136|nr:ECF transporter S component [Clostridium peptidivorans]